MTVDNAIARYSKKAAHPYPSRDQHRMAEGRSVIGHQAAGDQKNRSWTNDAIEQFGKRWPLGSKRRTAFHLFPI
ncbi:MAG TPA: hypothetical protein VJS63_06015 [Bradyrhizobium sp.]|nr:hypothetical protein [Bradyrhizobium sp.]